MPTVPKNPNKEFDVLPTPLPESADHAVVMAPTITCADGNPDTVEAKFIWDSTDPNRELPRPTQQRFALLP
jgi:hypothetical protein